MVYAILLILILAVILGPQLWVRHVMAAHAGDRPDFPGTGGELARHLLDLAGLQRVKVESLPIAGGDHYDSRNSAVRLSQANHDGRSVTAVAVAAHEVSHALQHAEGYRPLALRASLARFARVVEIAGSVVLLAAPLLAVVTRSPPVFLMQVVAGLAVLFFGVVLHLVTLPVELNASFARALPLLERGSYLDHRDLPAARRVLRAAAFTYVASTLISLVNIARWLRVLRA